MVSDTITSTIPEVSDKISKKDLKITSKIVENIKKTRKLSMDKFIEIGKTLEKIMDDTKNKEVTELKTSLNNVKITEKNLNEIYEKYIKQTAAVKVLKEKIVLLKDKMNKHFNQMEADSQYLKTLDLIRPQYFNTLKTYNEHLFSVNSTIIDKLVEGEDKAFILKVIKESNEHAQRSTGLLSKAFLEHYEKYKNILNKDRTTYENDVKIFDEDSKNLVKQTDKENRYSVRYNKLLKLLDGLKKDYAESEADSRDFDNVINIIKTLFKNPNKIESFYQGKLDDKCAANILQTHIKNNLI